MSPGFPFRPGGPSSPGSPWKRDDKITRRKSQLSVDKKFCPLAGVEGRIFTIPVRHDQQSSIFMYVSCTVAYFVSYCFYYVEEIETM